MAKTQLKVVSLNLWLGGWLFKAARDFLISENADLMFLQEAYDGHRPEFEDRFKTVELLKQAFPEHHAIFTPNYLDTRAVEGPIEDGMLLLSRFPLKNLRNIYTDVPYGEYDQDASTDWSNYPVVNQIAEISINNETVKLINVHGPVWLEGTVETPRRLRFKESLFEELRQNPNTLISGDFNMRPQTSTVTELEQHLTNVFAGELTTTFNMLRKKNPGYADSVVDMMFVPKSWIVLEHHCPQLDISDHLPLIARFELGE